MKHILISLRLPTLLLLPMLFFAGVTMAQESDVFQNKNSVQLDLGGGGLFYSFNYERILFNGEKFKTAAQIGVSYYPPGTGMRDLWIPMGITEIFSFGNHHIEAGLGFIAIKEAARDSENNPDYWFWSTMFSGRVGYRYQKPEGRFLFRAGFTPVLEVEWDHNITEFHPLAGVSFGYTF